MSKVRSWLLCRNSVCLMSCRARSLSSYFISTLFFSLFCTFQYRSGNDALGYSRQRRKRLPFRHLFISLQSWPFFLPATWAQEGIFRAPSRLSVFKKIQAKDYIKASFKYWQLSVAFPNLLNWAMFDSIFQASLSFYFRSAGGADDRNIISHVPE